MISSETYRMYNLSSGPRVSNVHQDIFIDLQKCNQNTIGIDLCRLMILTV